MEIFESIDGDNLYMLFFLWIKEEIAMKLIITRIDQGIVTCELEEGIIIDIASRWFSNDIQIGDIIEFDDQKIKKKNE